MLETVLTDFAIYSCLLLEVVQLGQLESDLARTVFDYIVPQISHYVESRESKSDATMSRFSKSAFYLNDQLYYVKRDLAIPVSSHTCATALEEAYAPVLVDHATGEIYMYDKDFFRWDNEYWTKYISRDDELEVLCIHEGEVYTLIEDHENMLQLILFNELGEIKSTGLVHDQRSFDYSLSRGQLFACQMSARHKCLINDTKQKPVHLNNTTNLVFSGSCEADLVVDSSKGCVEGVYNPVRKIIYPLQGHCPTPCIYDNQQRVHSLGKACSKLFIPVFQHGDTSLAYPLIEE